MIIIMIVFIMIICDSTFWQALFSYRDHEDIGNSHVERTGEKQTKNDIIKKRPDKNKNRTDEIKKENG